MTIYAHTTAINGRPFPAYVNLTQAADGAKLTVRSEGGDGRLIGSIYMTATQLRTMADAIDKQFGETN